MQFPAIQSFLDSVLDFERANGYVQTLFGRRRAIEGVREVRKGQLTLAERMAVNTVIQGTAAEIMKLAMISIRAEIEKRKMRSRMLLQVHDEVIFEVEKGEEQEMESLVRSCMEGAYKLSVPLRASIEFGSSWGEMH